MGSGAYPKYCNVLREHTSRTSSSLWRHIRSTIPLLQTGLESANTIDNDINGNPRWKGSASGKFSVASAYKCLVSSLSSSHIGWKHLWTMKGPTRFNLFLWQICHNGLPIAAFLHMRHLTADVSCMLCRHSLEDTLHALRDCSWANNVWSRLIYNEASTWTWTNMKIS